MSEAILEQDWLQQVELAFEKLKATCTAEREEYCEVIRDDHGAEAEAKLKAKLAAHDQAIQAKLTPPKPWRRDLSGAKAGPTARGDGTKIGRDILDVVSQPEAEGAIVNTSTAKARQIVSELKAKSEAKPTVTFHDSDKAGAETLKAPTIEERQRLFEELAALWSNDPLKYAGKKKELAQRLGVNQQIVERAVKQIRDTRAEGDKGEQSQATKVIAIGFSEGVKLWHAPSGSGYASVRVEDHWENYRIKSNAFEQWARAEYGRKNQVKIGEQWVPQVPATQALRDAILTLESYAKFQGDEVRPAVRIGGDRQVIYLDLGRPEWDAVEITAQGWRVVNRPNVAFVRTGTMLPMPIPVKGGNINELQSVLNVQPSDFVLAVGWLLQTMNPIGPYPLIDAHGEAEAGKTWLCKLLLRVVDPNSTGLRKAKKVEDLLIAARNNWTIGFDNLSWMSKEWADTLCMLATGIATGGRALYTDDEEHTFTVQRPVLFNGIPVDLTERSDLASRTIKLEILPIIKRRTEYDLEKEFDTIWPRVLGALLDGLVGALAGQEAIEVDDPARLIDFEKFAEAGCRAMGFDEWEFVEAYKSNRHGSMVVAAEASSVGRAVTAFLKAHPKGFRGQISALYQKLEIYKGNAHWNDWPRSPTKLSSELSRVSKPLAALGITCLTKVDRRSEGGTQKDAVIEWKDQPLPKLQLVPKPQLPRSSPRRL